MNDPSEKTAEVLLLAIVNNGPLTWSTEGIDDCCFFCGANVRSRRADNAGGFERWAVHSSGCTWVLGRRLFGIDLGIHVVSE